MDLFERNIKRSNSSRQRSGRFRTSTGISKPRHVFVFIINDANIDAQTANPFLDNTFSVSTDPRTLSNCHLEVGNGNDGTTKLTFKYELSGTTATVYALTPYEQDVELIQKDGKILLRS